MTDNNANLINKIPTEEATGGDETMTMQELGTEDAMGGEVGSEAALAANG